MFRFSPDPLEAAADEQQRLAADDRAMALVDLGRDDQVHLAELVLEQHEDDSVRGRRALARDRHAGEGDTAAVRRLVQLVAREHPGGRCGRSSVSGCTSTETLVARVVGEHPLPRGQIAAASGVAAVGSSSSVELLVLALDGLRAEDEAELPEQVAPLPPAVAGAAAEERLELARVERRSASEIADVRDTGPFASRSATSASASSSPTDFT